MNNKSITDALVKDLGIDTKSIAQEVVSGYIKEQVFGQKKPVSRNTKFSNALNAVADFFRSIWWVPAMATLSMGMVLLVLAVTRIMLGV